MTVNVTTSKLHAPLLPHGQSSPVSGATPAAGELIGGGTREVGARGDAIRLPERHRVPLASAEAAAC
jgi:hypothetical protein